ncbi:leucine-rich repeat domain-containing protein [archaeon]|nr:MAG: leucine-rich repeat domain-containing protein [archaeon]
MALLENKIQTLPLSLTQCTRLQKLHLGSNKIEYLPAEIFTAMTELTELYLYKNKIQALPPEIGNLQGN